jgi:E3 ubiquitin-protein ligase HUWE1
MLGLITLLLVDGKATLKFISIYDDSIMEFLERTTQCTLHTLLLAAFERVGGLEAIFDVCRQFASSIETMRDVKIDERPYPATKELLNAYGGLKVALHLIYPLISSKPLFESGQTVIAVTRGKKEDDPEYFEPHNFLVKLRLKTLPLVRQLWESHWLLSAPLGMCRSVVQVVMELVGADNEETKGEIVDMPAGSSSRAPPAPIVPDENRIRQLTDMGFPRSAAERALVRTRNNINSATELLLSHPFPLPPDPDPTDDLVEDGTSGEPSATPEDGPSQSEDGPSQSEDGPSQPEDGPSQPEDGPSQPAAGLLQPEVATSTGAPTPPPQDAEPTDESPRVKNAEDWRTVLNEAREPLRASIAPQALRLLDEHPSLIFDLHVAFVRPADTHQKQAVESLIEDIQAFCTAAYDAQQQPLANRCRLLALVLKETPSSLPENLKDGLMESLMRMLMANPITPEGHPTIAKWVSTHLLVTEALFVLGDQPPTINLPKEGEAIPEVDLTVVAPLTQARTVVFDFCIRLLAIRDLPGDELLAALRLIVFLTRDYQIAREFAHRNGINLLFARLKASAVPAGHSYVAIILRHVVEDRNTLQNIMQVSLKQYFALPRTRIVDAQSYVRNCCMMALRDPRIFVDVTKSLCQLSQPFSSPHHISLKPDVTPSDKPGSDSTPAEETKMLVDAPLATPSPDTLEPMVHFLIGELIKSARPTADMVPVDTSATDSSISRSATLNAPSDAAPKPTEPEADHSSYACLLMQFLTELLFSYEACKLAFLSYSPKKRSHISSKEASQKYRTAAVHFLLSELVAFESLNPNPSTQARNRVPLVNWAMSVLLALCVDTSASNEHKEVSSDLMSVRKFVLEAISRAIKDSQASESVDARYGRLLALSELCYRVLTARFSGMGVRKVPQDELPTQIAKIMLEKNFVATLTNALAEVDLNYPNVKSLVASILRPLEYLYAFCNYSVLHH